MKKKRGRRRATPPAPGPLRESDPSRTAFQARARRRSGRFVALGLPEFHILDRDVPPVSQTRHQIAAMVNSRARCRAAVTSKRALENYLHRDAIFEASGFSAEVTDADDLPDLVARRANERHEPVVPWDDLTHRARKRLRYKAKRWLNTGAVEKMTAVRLAERDGSCEVRSWLATIAAINGR